MRHPTAAAALSTFIRRHAVVQVGLVVLVWLAGQAIVDALRLPVPGGLVGLCMLLAVLMTRRVDVRLVSRGAHWLLAEMLLFFVPAVMAVSQHHELLGPLGLRLLGVILAGTVLVMAGTAWIVDLCVRRGAAVARAGH